MFCNLVFFVLWILFATPQTFAQQIGYGSSNFVISDEVQESFYMGFEIGLKAKLKTKPLEKSLLKESDLSKSPLGASKTAKLLLEKGVKLLTGFPGSHDCLLAAKVAVTSQIPAIFANCSHEKISEFHNQIFAFDSSMKFEVLSLVLFSKEFLKVKNLNIVYSPFHIASLNQKEIFDELRKKETNLSITFFPMNEDGELKEEDINKIKRSISDPILITVYPNLLEKFKDQLLNAKIGNPIIGGSSWDNSESIKRLFLNFKNDIFHSSGFDRSSPILSRYSRLRGGVAVGQITAEEIFGYDLGQVVGELWVQVNKIKNMDIKKVLIHGFCVDQLSFGKTCIKGEGGFIGRPRWFYKVAGMQRKKVYHVPVNGVGIW